MVAGVRRSVYVSVVGKNSNNGERNFCLLGQNQLRSIFRVDLLDQTAQLDATVRGLDGKGNSGENMRKTNGNHQPY